MKTAVFNVRADVRQSARWKQAAEAEGFRSVGQWAAGALDAYVEHRRTAGRPLPLAWSLGRFHVRLEDGSEPELRGWIARPFGHFRGSPEGPIPHGSTHRHSLVYLPERRILATFRYARHCRSLASDLAPLLLRDEQAAAAVTARHLREAT